MTEEKKSDNYAAEVLKDFKRAYEYRKKWLEAAKRDFEFTLGKQWETEDVSALESQGVMALTINKIRPSIWLLTGLESQNRTDWAAFPEGAEDSLVAEVATRLLKSVAKNSGVNYKISQAFEDALTCGEGWLEPYIDYTYDLLNGDMKFKKLDYNQVFPDPCFKEYDLSDAEFVDKVTWDLTEDQLVGLYPDAEKKIREIQDGRLNVDNLDVAGVGGVSVQRKGYRDATGGVAGEYEQKTYDLLEHYYKKQIAVYHVLDRKLGKVIVTPSKEEADKYAEGASKEGDGVHSVRVVKRMVPEIWVCAIVGGEEIDRKRASSYPEWKTYPFIPNFCYWSQTPLDRESRHLAVQGVSRGMIDLNLQYNKRKTQELRHLNQSTNSGWLSEENSWVNEDEVKKFGAASGVLLKYKAGRTPPQKIMPTPLSQGHTQLAAENTQDLKESSGINADLLAMQEGGQASGRAISLRQRQGLVMVQKVFDNLSQTKWILGKYILSQLSKVFDLESAARVLGEAFIMENFSKPVLAPMPGPMGQPVMAPQVDPMTGQPQMEIDKEKLIQTLTKVLQDTGLGKYDVAVGESATNETVKYANYTTLLDMASKGVPIPPDVLVEESQISNASKQKIKAAIEQQSQLPAPPPKGGSK
jgi:hypothetical protein